MDKLSFTIYVTTRCNMACRYCYEREFAPMAMPLDVAGRTLSFVLDKVSGSAARHVNIKFHGGEPLLSFPVVRFLMAELEKRAAGGAARFHYSMTTNGTLLSPDMLPTLGRLDELSVSIDGEEDTHDRNRTFPDRKGTYGMVSGNIKALLAVCPHVTGRMTLTPHTYETAYAGFLHLLSLGLRKVEMELDFRDPSWTESMIAGYLEQLKKVADEVSRRKRAGASLDVPLLGFARGKTRNAVCGGGRSSFVIAPNGEVYPCLMSVSEKRFLLGNVGGQISGEVLAELSKMGRTENPACAGCARYDYCRSARCKLINYLCTGDYLMPNPVLCAEERLSVAVGSYFADLA
ncbi:MAG: radical SAM protein [Clostridium sp.]|jgi:uncharacterized protein|nr:radical SAM protein [Clostridium sp.]